MDDIEAIIEASKHYRFSDGGNKGILNRISDLPESKVRLKRAIKERIQLLVAAYISLASFVTDEDADYVAGLYGKVTKKKVRRVYAKVIYEIKKLEAEIKSFDPFE